jgi:hypothetical protein
MVENSVHESKHLEDRPCSTSIDLKPLENQDAIREQLSQLLAHPLFSHSKRLPAFLSFIVEKTLCGSIEDLKERIIGVEVFGRSAGYDTNESPIVRVTAGELRKRLELYYHEAGREAEVRIELPVGCYVPTFTRPAAVCANPTLLAAFDAVAASPAQNAGKFFEFKPVVLQWLSYRILWLAVAGGLVLCSAFFYRATRADSAVDQFWSGIVGSRNPVVLCLARGTGSSSNPAGMGIMMPDVETMSSIRDTLQAHKREFRVLNASSDDLTQLNADPVVFVGPFHTAWVKQMTDPFRFHVVHEAGAPTAVIEDRQNPAFGGWVEAMTSGGPKTETHALLARFVNSSTGQPVVIATGLSPLGTVAAGEILTNPQYMNELLAAAPGEWQKMNLEAVVSAQIVGGQAGPPQIDAVYFWQ